MMTVIKNLTTATLVVLMFAAAITGEPGCERRPTDPCSPTACVVPPLPSVTP